MSNAIEAKRILELVPHRYPILLVDRVLDYQKFDYIKAIKNVSVNEPVFSGHFPGNPIMPGVLMLEALAQASAILFNLSHDVKHCDDYIHFFAGIDKAKFKHIVIPGDQLRLEIKLIGQKGDFWRMQGEVYVEDKLACSAELMSASKEQKK